MSAFNNIDIKTTADSSWDYTNSLFVSLNKILPEIYDELNTSEVDDNFFEFNFNKLSIT